MAACRAVDGAARVMPATVVHTCRPPPQLQHVPLQAAAAPPMAPPLPSASIRVPPLLSHPRPTSPDLSHTPRPALTLPPGSHCPPPILCSSASRSAAARSPVRCAPASSSSWCRSTLCCSTQSSCPALLRATTPVSWVGGAKVRVRLLLRWRRRHARSRPCLPVRRGRTGSTAAVYCAPNNSGSAKLWTAVCWVKSLAPLLPATCTRRHAQDRRRACHSVSGARQRAAHGW